MANKSSGIGTGLVIIVVGGLAFIYIFPMISTILGLGLIAVGLSLVFGVWKTRGSDTSNTSKAIGIALVAFGLIPAVLGGRQLSSQSEEQERKEEAAEAERERQLELKQEIGDLIKQVEDALEGSNIETAARIWKRAADLNPTDRKVILAGKQIDVARHRQALANMPAMLEDIQEHSSKKEWAASVEACAEASKINPKHPGLSEACTFAEEGKLIEEALELAGSTRRCDSLFTDEILEGLEEVDESSEHHAAAKSARAKIKRCLRKAKRSPRKTASLTDDIPFIDTPQASRRDCCRHCKTGKPCGNSCISANKVCRKPPGCAC